MVEVDLENGGLLWTELLMMDVTVLAMWFTDSCLHVHHRETSDERLNSNIHLVEDMDKENTLSISLSAVVGVTGVRLYINYITCGPAPIFLFL